MKAFRSCSLFQRQSGAHPIRFWVWNWCFIVAAGLGCGLLSLLLALGHYRWAILLGYFRHPLICLLNVLPPLLLMLLLYCLIGRAWIAFLATSLLTLGASAGNYFKLIFRDDPFLFADIPSIGMAFRFVGGEHYALSLDARLALCLAYVILGTLFLFFFVRGRSRARFRLLGAAVLVLACLPLSRVYLSENVYENKTQNYEYANRWSATQVFVTRGFVYPFLHSIPDAFPEKPAGYSEAAAQSILAAYTDEDIPAERKVNLIGIQLEAFNDLERIGFTGISEEVYAQYRALEAESITGSLVTNIFAGGTVDTERCFLTGFTQLDDFRRDTGSYVRYFKEQGYYTEGSHSCYDWFYNRRNVNAYLGFDRYWFYENRYAALANDRIALDDILIPDILALYQARDPSVPYFGFSVTYQGHGPYTMTGLDWGDGYWQGEYDEEETYYILNNYLGSVQNTAENLTALTDALREDEAPVVLVVFGDHNPWLGYSNSVYNALNIDLDTATERGFYNYYDTRYLIWANEAAKRVLGNDFIGAGPDVSPCFLMNVVFEACGFGRGSAYMQLMEELRSYTGVVHTGGFYAENGTLSRTLSPGAAEVFARQQIAQYFRKRHPAY